jgi:hypothetical protein
MSPRPLVFATLSLLLLAGCKDREITAYQAPKDPPPTMPGMTAADNSPAAPGSAQPPSPDQTMANTAVPTASGSDLTWTAPATWTAKSASAMRKGSYAIKGDGGEADLSITAFPGSTGGLLANLNRWRGQLGLAPLAENELGAATVHLDAGELHLDVVDFSGTAAGKPTRILGAVVPHGSDTWFFKLMGPDALVANEKPAFLEFLRTIKPR